MRHPDLAAILSVGDELLCGDVVDTNAAWLDERLAAAGWRVGEHRVVPDEEDRIVEALGELAERYGRIVVTGGLGPTDDDRTLAAVARTAGVRLEHHAETFERIRRRFERRGRTLRDGHRRQALLPAGAWVEPNPIGSAPGLELPVRGTSVTVLPGVPTEMRALFEQMAARAPVGPGMSARRVLRTVGLGESDLEARVAAIRAGRPDLRFGFRSVGLVQEVRLYGPDGLALDAVADEVESALEGHVFGRGAAELPEAVGQVLAERGQTVATAESCTGGMVAAALTDVAGSSAYFRGGVVAYANDVKETAVGVDPALLSAHGAVSEVVARALAAGVRARLGTTFGVSATGIAGPGGGTPEKPVGLVWIAGDGPDGAWSRELRIEGDRATIRRRTVQHVLAELWRRARAAPPPSVGRRNVVGPSTSTPT